MTLDALNVTTHRTDSLFHSEKMPIPDSLFRDIFHEDPDAIRKKIEKGTDLNEKITDAAFPKLQGFTPLHLVSSL